ncbi:hypothetical protein E2C01_019579 [Portunus trituberculatus]|uniref:Uncharacterized protein n=1 Tax=Portunus trituberculatus TaxID=210409 RepID=A0A5B7DY04_PORTR|nr:hypothetical protein [Portunus trituberculatus]
MESFIVDLTCMENNSRDSTRTISLQRIKTREGITNIFTKNFYFRDNIVSGKSKPTNIFDMVLGRNVKGISFIWKTDVFLVSCLSWTTGKQTELNHSC